MKIFNNFEISLLFLFFFYVSNFYHFSRRLYHSLKKCLIVFTIPQAVSTWNGNLPVKWQNNFNTIFIVVPDSVDVEELFHDGVSESLIGSWFLQRIHSCFQTFIFVINLSKMDLSIHLFNGSSATIPIALRWLSNLHFGQSKLVWSIMSNINKVFILPEM